MLARPYHKAAAMTNRKEMEKRYTYRQLAAMSARELDSIALEKGLNPEVLKGMRNNEIITFIIRKQANL